MIKTKVTIQVPTEFADAIRRRRLITLSAVSALCLALALLFDQRAIFGAIACGIGILSILPTYRYPLMYRVSTHGIYLTTSLSLLSVPLSLAINYWLAWPFQCIAEVSYTHFEHRPALLIRTRFQRRGSILPICRADSETVAAYVRSLISQRGANAFS